MIVRDAKGNAEAFDFRTTAPAAASPDMFRDNRHLALAVSGICDGVWGRDEGGASVVVDCV